jgi:hypothetical protein
MVSSLRSTAATAATTATAAAAKLTALKPACSQQQRLLLSSNEAQNANSSALGASESSSSGDSSTSDLALQGSMADGPDHSSSGSSSDSSSSVNGNTVTRFLDSSVLRLHEEEFDDVCDTYYDDGYVGGDGCPRMHDSMVAIGIPHSVEPSTSGVLSLINGSADTQLVQKLQNLAGANCQVCYHCHYYNLLIQWLCYISHCCYCVYFLEILGTCVIAVELS